jgi:hypothetical protein
MKRNTKSFGQPMLVIDMTAIQLPNVSRKKIIYI